MVNVAAKQLTRTCHPVTKVTDGRHQNTSNAFFTHCLKKVNPMNKSLKTSLLLITSLMTIGAASAQQLKPEEMIQFRQAGYKTMAWNMSKIKAQVEAPSDKFDKTLTLNAVKAIQGVANSGLGALFAPGTDKSIGDVKTRVKADFFDPANKEELGKIAKNFNQEANKFAEVAAGGDQKAIQAQFGEVGKACKSCHDKFRMDDKK